MIEMDFDTGYTELGGGLSDAQRIINRIEDFKKKSEGKFLNRM